MNLPTKEECFEILKEYEVPQNIIEHSLMVNKVAIFLAKKLVEKSIKINIDLLDRASLLHDLDKIATLKDYYSHGKVSKEILEKKGFLQVGKIVSVHRTDSIKNNMVNTWEEKLLNYADGRVTNDKIVSLHERFEYGRKNYPEFNTPEGRESEIKKHELEKEIFSHLDFKPEDLKQEMEK
jgi:putative nucleotidyltransferase with HDIG domain|tara:strand:- start:222 stop:761 length:540 start_codon:yes stop_codon:yes gene_type:complete